MKYLSKQQILESLSKLAVFNQFFGLTFLAAKRSRLPIGKVSDLSLDSLNDKLLKEYYRPDPRSKYYFRVFRYNYADKHWLRPDYAGKGLQKLNTTSFKDAFIHNKKTKSWGWKPDYVDFLSKFLPQQERVPAFHLAVWLFRDMAWDDTSVRRDVVKHFVEEFSITKDEGKTLFSTTIESSLDEEEAFQPIPVNWRDIDAEFSPPPDIEPEKGGILTYLETSGIGPVSPLRFDPGNRLNIITGDNGLGKTFLLEAAWWALTGKWAGRPAYPNRLKNAPLSAQIKFQISGVRAGKPQTIYYSPAENRWPEPSNRATISGLIVYARVDGSFALWDPAGSSASPDGESILVFNRDEIWNGKPGRMEGLVRDWTKWQDKPSKYPFDIFKKVLARLSPPEIGILLPGDPVRIPLDPREIPTIKHNYGDVPILFESAGVRRVITLAYLMVWTWNEHKIFSEQSNRPLENRMVVLVDELEAHLHPRWQRSILPALLGVSTDLSSELELQLIVSTHSPLVLASAESVFDESLDKLFHLETSQNGKVLFSQVPFVRYGPVDSWLTSGVFHLSQARSREAETVINRAIALQKEKKPSEAEVRKVHDLLQDTLPAEDAFWPRWIFFARKYGVNL